MKRLRDMTEKDISVCMNEIANRVRDSLPEKTLFFCLAFDDPGVAQYVSNANSKDIIEAMRETATRLERGQEIPR